MSAVPATNVETMKPRRSGAKQVARKDSDGQEKVIELDALRDRLEHLIGLRRQAKEAADEYGEAVKAVAERAGLLSTTVRKFVAARAGDDFSESARKAEQLAMVFEEVGG